MNNEAKSYIIELCGETYTIVSDETQSHIDEIVSYTRRHLEACLPEERRRDHQDVHRAAMLSLLRLASELIHIQKRFHQQAQQQDGLIHQIDQLLQSFT